MTLIFGFAAAKKPLGVRTTTSSLKFRHTHDYLGIHQGVQFQDGLDVMPITNSFHIKTAINDSKGLSLPYTLTFVNIILLGIKRG